MDYLILQPGVATTIFDFTSEFSQSLVRSVGLVGLLATMIAVIALRRYELEKMLQVPRKYGAGDRRKAA